MDGQENVARVLKSVWMFDGELSPAAFNLRSHIHEIILQEIRIYQLPGTARLCYLALNTPGHAGGSCPDNLRLYPESE